MKLETIQNSFAGGEIAPALFGRTDVAQYATAVALLENFLVRPFGSAISTPGTEFINECKTGGSTSIVRLLPFVFSRTDAYIIEMGVGYFRFYTNGAVVCSTGTTPFEVAHTYTATEIFEVQICQLNDVIYIVHPSHPPAKLTRLAAANWTLTDFPFIGGAFLPDNTEAITIVASGVSGTVNLTVSPTNANLFVPSGATLGHKNTYWKLGGTSTNATTGLTEQGYVQITNVVNSYTATASVIKLLTATALTASTLWAEGAWSVVNGYPARVTFHQQRLYFARTDQQPQNIWGSKPFDYINFAVDGGADDDAIDIQLASNESNDIKWLAPGSNLIAGTYGGEFTIGSGDNSPMTPSNTNVSKQSSWGSAAVVPVKIGNFFYYIQRFGKKLRELFYTWDLDTYKSVDKTILAPHISGNGGFIDMAFQQNPDTIIWLVCLNGTLSTLTREIDQQVQGWARQITNGLYESIASIPSATQPHDEMWVVVKRAINGSTVRYIERFKSQEVPERQDQCWYVHSGLNYDGYGATQSPTATSISLSATGGTILVTSSDVYFAAGDVGQRLRAIDAEGNVIGELEITGFTSSTIVLGTARYNFDALSYAAGYWGVSVNSISGLGHLEGKTVTVLADGGTDKPNKVVSNGAITLAYDYFYVTIGLPFTQKLITLPQEAASQRGTAVGKKQRINEVAFKVNRSHKGFRVGGSASELDTVSYIENTTREIIYTGTIPNAEFVLEKVSYRDPATPMGTPEILFTGTIPNVSFRANYEYGSQVVLQNEDPLPIEILNIVTAIDTNDK